MGRDERAVTTSIGIDLSPTACRVMAKRLKDVCKLVEGRDFVVRDLPRSEKQLARKLA